MAPHSSLLAQSLQPAVIRALQRVVCGYDVGKISTCCLVLFTHLFISMSKAAKKKKKHTHKYKAIIKPYKDKTISCVARHPFSQRPTTNKPLVTLIRPWLWPHYINSWPWPTCSEDTPVQNKWSSQVKVFVCYSLNRTQTQFTAPVTLTFTDDLDVWRSSRHSKDVSTYQKWSF